MWWGWPPSALGSSIKSGHSLCWPAISSGVVRRKGEEREALASLQGGGFPPLPPGPLPAQPVLCQGRPQKFLILTCVAVSLRQRCCGRPELPRPHPGWLRNAAPVSRTLHAVTGLDCCRCIAQLPILLLPPPAPTSTHPSTPPTHTPGTRILALGHVPRQARDNRKRPKKGAGRPRWTWGPPGIFSQRVGWCERQQSWSIRSHAKPLPASGPALRRWALLTPCWAPGRERGGTVPCCTCGGRNSPRGSCLGGVGLLTACPEVS